MQVQEPAACCLPGGRDHSADCRILGILLAMCGFKSLRRASARPVQNGKVGFWHSEPSSLLCQMATEEEDAGGSAAAVRRT